MSLSRRRLGRAGERVAARHIKRAGLRVIARNWHCAGVGEIDIVARDGDQLVIVEVRTRRAGAGPWSPESSVTPAKRQRLYRLADAWERRHPQWRPASTRVDLVAIEHRGFLRWTVRWHKAL